MAKNNQEIISAQTETKETKPENHSVVPAKKKSKWLIKLVLLLVIGLSGACAFLWLQLQKKDGADMVAITAMKEEYEKQLREVSDRMDVLSGEIKRLKNASQGQRTNGIDGIQLTEAMSALEAKMLEHIEEAKLAAPERVISVSDKEAKMKQEILLASGAMMIRNLAEQELPFAYEAEVLRIMAQGNEPAMKYAEIVQHFASAGIKGKSVLIKDFNRIYPNYVTKNRYKHPTVVSVTEKSFWQKTSDAVLKWFRNFFVLEKIDEVLVWNPDNDKVYELVNEGNLAAALNEFILDASYNRLVEGGLYEWIGQVRKYVEFEKAINGLIMNAIANLHLKEMEH